MGYTKPCLKCQQTLKAHGYKCKWHRKGKERWLIIGQEE